MGDGLCGFPDRARSTDLVHEGCEEVFSKFGDHFLAGGGEEVAPKGCGKGSGRRGGRRGRRGTELEFYACKKKIRGETGGGGVGIF